MYSFRGHSNHKIEFDFFLFFYRRVTYEGEKNVKCSQQSSSCLKYRYENKTWGNWMISDDIF